MTTPDEQEAAYDASRRRIAELTLRLDDAALATTVPCCPRWSVKDLVGHLTGLLEDRRDARLPTEGMDGWTMAQVERHRDEPLSVVLDTWRSLEPDPEHEVPSLEALSFDVVTHEHDLCQAVGNPGARDTDSVRVGAVRAAGRMASMLDGSEGLGVRVTTEDGEQLLGHDSDPITLATTRYALMRLVTARMSRAQAEALAWGAEPDAVLDALFADGFFVLQPTDVVESPFA